MTDISKVNAVKRDAVEQAVEIAQETDVIKRLIVFGSAVTNDCGESSDIDLCLDVSCDTRDMRLFRPVCDFNKACDYNCDILFYQKIGDKLKKEIDTKGVEVYVA